MKKNYVIFGPHLDILTSTKRNTKDKCIKDFLKGFNTSIKENGENVVVTWKQLCNDGYDVLEG